MPEISIEALEPRWQSQVAKVRAAAAQADHHYVIAVGERILEEFPGCLEVRQLLRAAQRGRARRNTTGFARWLGGMGMQLRTGGLARKDPLLALAEAEAALARDPENLIAHRILGEAALSCDLPGTAVFAFTCIRELDPGNRDNLLALGGALIKADRAREAMALGEAILAEHPGDAHAEGLLKDASVAHSLSHGNWEEPGDRGGRSAIPPGLPPAVGGRSSGETGSARHARVAELEAAIAREPDELRHYHALAEVWRELGEPTPALDWVQRARARPAGGADAALAELARTLEGELLRQRLVALRAEAEAQPDSATAREALRQTEREVLVFERARLQALVITYPEDADLRLELAEWLLGQGQAEEAIPHFQHLIDEPGRSLDARFGLGRAFKYLGQAERALGQIEGALGQIERALAGSPTDGARHKALLYERADLAESLGREDAAKTAFADLFALDPEYRDVAARRDRCGHSAG